MRNLSLATRAFLISLLPLCLVMTFIFIGLNVVLRDKSRDGIKRFVHTSEALLERMNENNHQRTAQVASLLTENRSEERRVGKECRYRRGEYQGHERSKRYEATWCHT